MVVIFWVSVTVTACLLFFALLGYYKLNKAKPGNDTSQPIAQAIAEAASGFLVKSNVYQLTLLLIISPIIILSIIVSPVKFTLAEAFILIPVAIVAPLLISGNVYTALLSDRRISVKVKENLHRVFRYFLYTGILSGLTLAFLVLPVFAYVLYLITNSTGIFQAGKQELLFYACLPISLAAFFYRGMSGIFTKSADQSIDMLRNTESVIPSRDLRNPAEILHKAGKIFSDRGAIGISMLESLFFAMAFCLVIALELPESAGQKYLLLPISVLGAGILASIIGFFFIRTRDEASPESLLWSLRLGNYTGTFFLIAAAFPLFFTILKLKAALFACFLAGLTASNLIYYFSEYFTAENFRPVSAVSAQASSGAQAVITSGLKYGMRSLAFPMFLALLLFLASYFLGASGESSQKHLFGIYGIALGFTGFMSQFVSFMATSSIAASADSAYAICQLGDVEPVHTRKVEMIIPPARTSFAALKLLSIFSMLLMAILVCLYLLKDIQPTQVGTVLHAAGIILGAALPYLISATAITSVGRTTGILVKEIKRQFKETPGILEKSARPDYHLASLECNNSSFYGTLKAFLIMLGATLLAAFVGGIQGITGLIMGFAVSGFYWTIVLHHSGSIWASSRRKTEKDPNVARGSALESAMIIADLTGDPLKDASAPLVSSGVKLAVVITILSAEKLSLLFQLLVSQFFS